MNVRERWERLVIGLRRRGVVPLIGAGVSVAARTPRDPGFRPTIETLKGTLRAALRNEHLGGFEHAQDVPTDHAAAALLDGAHRKDASPSIDDYLGRAPLDRLAEVLRALEGAPRVVERLAMECFATLDPTTAHRMIARLAREELVTDVVSTNYDSCLERAFQATFRHPRPAPFGHQCPAVIVDAVQHRELGAVLRTPGPGGGEPVLHVYKLNGCAQRWVDRAAHPMGIDECDREARRIALTDTDLHELGDPWKEDLLRQVARTRTVLLSGFGSDEAQVRYTLLEVIREHQADGHVTPGASGDPWLRPGAPFVHAYERSLSYAQFQVLAAYAHGRAPAGLARTPAWNVVSGSDAAWFLPRPRAAGDMPYTLDADTFWSALYADVVQRELADRLNDASSEAARWIKGPARGAPVRHDALGSRLALWLRSRDEAECRHGPLRAWLAAPARTTDAVPRSAWDRCICGARGTPPAANDGQAWGSDEYRPLRMHETQWAALAFVLRGLLGPEPPPERLACNGSAGVVLRVGRTECGDGAVLLAAHASPGDGLPESYRGTFPSFVVHVAEPHVRAAGRTLRRETSQPAGAPRLEVRRTLAVTGAQLAAEARVRGGWLDDRQPWLTWSEVRRAAAATARPAPRNRLRPHTPAGGAA